MSIDLEELREADDGPQIGLFCRAHVNVAEFIARCHEWCDDYGVEGWSNPPPLDIVERDIRHVYWRLIPLCAANGEPCDGPCECEEVFDEVQADEGGLPHTVWDWGRAENWRRVEREVAACRSLQRAERSDRQ